MKKYNVGLVVGKFCPLHKGHELVVNTAIEQCEFVYLISYTSRNLGYTAETRLKWIQALWPNHVLPVVIHEGLPKPDDDTASAEEHRNYCAGICEGLAFDDHDYLPQAVFSSETYGIGFAAHLAERWNRKVDHVMVDHLRNTVPISGTELRGNPKLMSAFTSEIVHAT